MTNPDAKRRGRMIEGNKMRCPRCKEQRDILAYVRLEQNQEFESETNPIYKCPKAAGGCSYLFSPTDEVILSAMLGTEDRS